MKTGLAISALCHALLLVWGLLSFAGKPLEAKPNDALPVDIISDKQFSEITKGAKDGAKDKPQALLAEKIGTANPIDDSRAKVTEKKVLDAAKAEAPPPPAEQSPAPKETKLEKKEPPKIDPIAEALKKEEAKKKAEEKAKAKAVQQAQAKPQPQFDALKIAALLDKREPTRQAAMGEALVPVPGLGAPSGSAAKLSQSEIDALKARLTQLWNLPAGVQNPDELKVTILIKIGKDRRLNGPPRVLTSGNSPQFVAARDSAIRALFLGQPFDMLRDDHYEHWKEIEFTFDPRFMFGGG